MIRAGVGQSSNGSTREAVHSAATDAMAQAGVARADAAVVFFTAEHAAGGDALLETLRSATGAQQIAGCSAAAVLSSAGELEGDTGIAVLVLSSDQVRSRALFVNSLRGRDREAGAEIARGARADETSLLALLPDTYRCQPRELLGGIEAAAGFVPVVGAGASENAGAQTTYQLGADGVTSNAVCGLQLSGSFQTSIDITQGCQPITRNMVITKADQNLIFEIDHRPAFEVFSSVLKGPLAEDLRRALTFVFAGVPADPKKNKIGPGQYLVRNIVGLDPKSGVIAVAEEVSEGEAIIFTLRDGQRARDDLNQMLERQKRKLEGRKPAFGFYFNCCARGSSLYGVPGIDTAYIRQTLGDFPLIGMFGGYELAPLGGANHLFAYTGVLALVTD